MISAVIITKNEEDNIEDCILSLVGVVNEIVIVDSNSTDRTKEICSKFNVNFHIRDFLDYSDQKNYGNSLAKYDYILSIDADERLSEELRNSIKQESNNYIYDVYSVSRRTNYCGKWINYSGWYPNKKFRIWKKGIAKWKGTIHEGLTFNTEQIGYLNGDLLHYSYKSINEHLDRINIYSSLMAEEIINKNKKITIFHLSVKPIFKILHRYFFKLGFMDGFYGLVISILSGYYTFFKYSKAIVMKKNINNYQNT